MHHPDSRTVLFDHGACVIITVAICTLNRAESLRRTLRSLAEMSVPDDIVWEVVVVNNDCTDDTDTVIKAFADGQLPIRREFEPRRGLSLARNHAVDAAKGDYIAWIDDDVIVDPGWLTAYADAFHRWPEAAVFGGPITPRFIPPLPKWFADAEPYLSGRVFARRDVNKEGEILLAERRIPYGPNFALRAIEQRAFRYDLELGPGPGRRRRAEETDVILRVLGAGASGRWVPGARVEHWSQPNQQTMEYVQDWFKTLGEAEAVIEARQVAVGPLWFGAPRWLWRRLIAGWAGYLFHRVFSPPRAWVPYMAIRITALGAIQQWRSLGDPARGDQKS
jgi:glycosyltransferase involved in cell wall biosynthesis